MLNPNLEAIELTKEEYQRYSRHIILPEVGLEGQKRCLCWNWRTRFSSAVIFSRGWYWQNWNR
jgi:hypothetical protein